MEINAIVDAERVNKENRDIVDDNEEGVVVVSSDDG